MNIIECLNLDTFIVVSKYLDKLTIANMVQIFNIDTEEFYRGLILNKVSGFKTIPGYNVDFSFKRLWQKLDEQVIISLNSIYDYYIKSLYDNSVELLIFTLSTNMIPYQKYILGIKILTKLNNVDLFCILIEHIERKDSFIIDFIIKYKTYNEKLQYVINNNNLIDYQNILIKHYIKNKNNPIYSYIKFIFDQVVCDSIKDVELLKWYIDNIHNFDPNNFDTYLSRYIVNSNFIEGTKVLLYTLKVKNVEKILTKLIMKEYYHLFENLLELYKISKVSTSFLKEILKNEKALSIVLHRMPNYESIINKMKNIYLKNKNKNSI